MSNEDLSDGALQQLARDLGEKLLSAGKTIATAESCTAGWIAKVVTDVPGSSSWFGLGIASYSNEAKQDVLGVSPATLELHGAVSEECVLEMVAGITRLSGADVAVAVSGIAGPEGGSPDKPVGTVWFGFQYGGLTKSEVHVFAGDRERVRRRTVQYALQHLIGAVS